MGSVPEGDPFVDESWLDCDEARTAALASIPVGWQPSQPHPTPSPTGTATHGPDQLLTRPKNAVRSAQVIAAASAFHVIDLTRSLGSAMPRLRNFTGLALPPLHSQPLPRYRRPLPPGMSLRDLWDYHGVNFTLSTERLSPCDWRLYALAARGAWHGVQ